MAKYRLDHPTHYYFAVGARHQTQSLLQARKDMYHGTMPPGSVSLNHTPGVCPTESHCQVLCSIPLHHFPRVYSTKPCPLTLYH